MFVLVFGTFITLHYLKIESIFGWNLSRRMRQTSMSLTATASSRCGKRENMFCELKNRAGLHFHFEEPVLFNYSNKDQKRYSIRQGTKKQCD